MYLKSLTLKGFKSFADRTVMRFEPGVAAIVGPNGSGKSNISDAVLWVLGERNAKNLRGQSMEDVIFAGSSARKPVSVAEVELLLDNADGTLPVDFAEVSIGRRMYRSGESDYLINGNVVRRMDVLDILHDSGLGTGTNSIISQGNLDSVLSSRPEDRRALIEEAAGILKHKERKAKSERKLAQMDAHLERVNDIAAEVTRQLKPLERKARKARTYQGLAEELSGLRLELAVDELRSLKRRMEAAEEREGELARAQAHARADLEQAEAALDALQRQLHDRGEQEEGTRARVRRAQNALDRLGSTLMVLRERRSSLLAEVERHAVTLEEGRARRAAAEKELAEAERSVEEASASHDKAKKRRGDAEIAHQRQVNERNDVRKRVDALLSEQRALSHRKDALEAARESLAQNLSEKQTRSQLVDAHVADARRRLEAARSAQAQSQAASEELEQSLSQAVSAEQDARERSDSLLVARSDARGELDQARNAYTRLSAERAALEELERAADASNPVLADALDRRTSLRPVSHVVSAPEGLEALVETLLGPDLQALLVDDRTLANRVLTDAAAGGKAGSIGVVAADCPHPAFDSACDAPLLIDALTIDQAYAAQVKALIGDVRLVDSLEEALAAQRTATGMQARFVTPEGIVAYPGGKVVFTRQTAEDREHSVLARRRALEAARTDEHAARARYERAQKQDASIEERLREAQTEALKRSEEVAALRGRATSAAAEAKRAVDEAAERASELERLAAEQEELAAFLERVQPDSDEIEGNLARVDADLALNKEEVAELQRSLNPLQQRLVALSEEVSDARLEEARLSERLAYAERMAATRRQEIALGAREGAAASRRIAVVRAAADRAERLMSTLGVLSDTASLLLSRLEERSRAEAEHARGLHERLTDATRASREARERHEAGASRLADVRIEKGRLEVQVETSVKAIVEDCGTSLETALSMEPIEDREEAAERAERLERRIKGMGNIDPDAAVEFEQVSERHRYLSSQLDDMRAARRSLARIVEVIDERMRDDFVKTFEEVNANFSEIFQTLFPGGQAHLSLVDPDDLENTGVDVNAQPVGKRVKKMSLLSGGEKSMTAMALLFAVYRIRSTPFYILDEVEAALDDTNLRRLIAYLNVIRDDTQFIMITHQRRTMESADILYGVSMQADGITKVVSQKLDNATRKEGQ